MIGNTMMLAAFIVHLLWIGASQAQSFSLTVNSGSSSGPAAGSSSSVWHIWANPNPASKVFDRWAGDTGALLDPFSAHTTLARPTANITITATYKDAPAWTSTAEAINGTRCEYYFPPQPKGVIFFAHGSGGNGGSWFTKVESRGFLNDAVAEGFAVFALDSVNRTDKQWNNQVSLSNPDIQNVQAALNLFISRGLTTTSTPVFALGMSNGGAFAPRVSAVLNFKGTAVFCASSQTQLISQTNTPTIWNMELNDEIIGQSGNQMALDNYNLLAGRNIPASIRINQPQPLYPSRFWKIPGLTQSDSQTIYNSIKNANLLDANDYLRASPASTAATLQAAIPSQYAPYVQDISSLLDINYTSHEFFSDHNRRTLDFFRARLAGAAGGVASVSAASYRPALAPESIAAAFGSGMASVMLAAATLPLPTSLAETRVRVLDSLGVERLAPLFFISPTQINYQTPLGAAPGLATITVSAGNGATISGTALLAAAAPGLFSANASGQGLAAAVALRVKADGTQIYEPVAQFDAAQNKLIAVAIDLGNANEQVFLLLYGTGIRYRSSLAAVNVLAGGLNAQVTFAGAQDGFAGLDQINVQLPRGLAGRGEVDVALTVDGQAANVVKIGIK